MEQQKQEHPSQSPAFKALENLRMRLLDLTARNRLINFRHTKTRSLRIIDELPNQLVETLLADTEVRFLAIREPTEKELIESGYLKFDEGVAANYSPAQRSDSRNVGQESGLCNQL